MNRAYASPAKAVLWSSLFMATLTLGGCNLFDINDSGQGKTTLAPCTASGSMFQDLAFKDWPDTYHTTVNDVIEAHRNALTDVSKQELKCTASDYASMAKPTDALQKLAATLPPWKRPEDIQKLSEVELGPVLLEYLRVYQCSLLERKNFIRLTTRDQNSSSSSQSNNRQQQDTASDSEQAIIDHELAIAEPTLQRVLLIVGGESRLRPLTLDIECLKRTSLDIRNILGLTSQATACMPRVLDARGGLRDLPQ